MIAALVAGAVAGFGIAMPVGPVGVYLVAVSASTALRVALAAALGVASVDGCYALLAVVGGATFAEVMTPVQRPLRWGAALVLGALAARLAFVAARTFGRDELACTPGPLLTRPARAFTTFVAVTVINPLTVVYFTALVVGSSAHFIESLAHRTAFVAAAFAASAVWHVLLACGGVALGEALAGRHVRLGTTLLSSVVVGVLAARTVMAP